MKSTARARSDVTKVLEHIASMRFAANAAGNHDFAVARINTNGTLDTAFNTTGKVAFSIGNSVDIARAVTLDTSARMLIAGYSWMGTQYDSVFAKLNTNGTLDTAFNSTGKKVFTVTASDNAFLGIEVGMAIAFAAGPAYDGAKWSTGVRRVDDGNGGNFPSAIISGANDIKLSVVKLAVGGTTINYLAGSESNGSNLDFVVYRMVADSLDTAFNTTGRFIASFGGGDDAASSIRVQTDGRVIVAGYGNDGSKDNFAVIRLKTDGTLDTSFFTTGKSSLSIGSGQDRVQGMDLLNDGNIVIGGRSWNGSNFDFGIIRLNFDGTAKKSGDLDLSFGTD